LSTVGRSTVDLPTSAADGREHPAVLDAGFQLLASLFLERGTYLPVGAARIIRHRSWPPRFWCHAQWNARADAPGASVAGDIVAHDEDGQVVLELRGVTGRRVSSAGSGRNTPEDWVRVPSWEPVPRQATRAAEPRRWLVFTDDSGVGADLVRKLDQR